MHWLQVSILRLFLHILADAPFRKQQASPEVVSFAVGIVRRVLARLVPTPDAAEPAEQVEAAAADACEALAFLRLQSPSSSELPSGATQASCTAQGQALRVAMGRLQWRRMLHRGSAMPRMWW